MSKHILTAASLREQFAYDPLTGVFTHATDKNPRARAGQPAGTTHKTLGYVYIGVDFKKCLAHRLAWLYVYGEHPANHIDHINGDRTDNRIENLRPATQLQNNRNRGATKGSKSGLKGACWDATNNRWMAMASVENKPKYLGRFDTPEQAHQAYCDFVRPLHGDYFRAS